MRPIFTKARRLLRTGSLVLGVFIAAFLTRVPPASALMCGPHANVVEQLTKGFQENPTSFGLMYSGVLLAELFVSATGSWTLIVTTPQKITCILAMGENWEDIPALEPKA